MGGHLRGGRVCHPRITAMHRNYGESSAQLKIRTIRRGWVRTFAVPVFAIHRCLLGKMQCTFENENWRGWVSTFAVVLFSFLPIITAEACSQGLSSELRCLIKKLEWLCKALRNRGALIINLGWNRLPTQNLSWRSKEQQAALVHINIKWLNDYT